MFSKNLRELRKSKELSAKKLSEALGVSMQNIYDWENEKNETDFATIIKIADYFDVSLDELLGRKEI